MIKARAGEVVIFGLSERNLELLRKGMPIKINMTELGLTGTILIFYGKTEEAMYEELKELVGPETKYVNGARS